MCNWVDTSCLSCSNGSGGQHCLARLDFDLEAFSRNPTDGSPTPKKTANKPRIIISMKGKILFIIFIYYHFFIYRYIYIYILQEQVFKVLNDKIIFNFLFSIISLNRSIFIFPVFFPFWVYNLFF